MKKLQIAALMAGVVLLAGCGHKTADNAGEKEAGQKQETKKGEREQKGGMITSIKDAMGLGQTMKCTYTMESEGEKIVSTSYVKGDKYMGETEVSGKIMKSVFDGEAIYMWDESEKKGTKMEKKCMDELEEENKKNQTSKPDENYDFDEKFSAEEAFDDAMDVKCEPSSDVDFSAPKDVKFEDMCQMLKGFQESLKNIKMPEGQMPEGGPGGMPGGQAPKMPNFEISE